MHRKLNIISRLAAVLAISATVFVPATSSYADNDNEDGESELERSQREDHETSGQVLEINTLVDPPQLKMSTPEGVATVYVEKRDEIARNGVRLGDHISIVGEKKSEVEWIGVTEIQVDAHLGDSDNEDGDDDDDDDDD
jgi:hypothetical protein